MLKIVRANCRTELSYLSLQQWTNSATLLQFVHQVNHILCYLTLFKRNLKGTYDAWCNQDLHNMVKGYGTIMLIWIILTAFEVGADVSTSACLAASFFSRTCFWKQKSTLVNVPHIYVCMYTHTLCKHMQTCTSRKTLEKEMFKLNV